LQLALHNVCFTLTDRAVLFTLHSFICLTCREGGVLHQPIRGRQSCGERSSLFVHCWALGSKIDKECVRPYVPSLLGTLKVCFEDDSWPVRDGK